jgi:3-hydroxyacyl-CoA dehydrogenase / enoyl-CoA hydratase / 3-hydroxybutyryl-CoA epimerase
VELTKLLFEIKTDIAYVGFGQNNSKSLTILDEKTLTELKEVMIDIRDRQTTLKGLIFYSLIPGVFLAGADIELIASLSSEAEGQEGSETGQKIFNMIEDLKIPSIACVDGICLGGGLELALSCTHILASDHAKTNLGLPEVKLGILPGFGGTYRLPKKVGLPAALDLILSGKTVDARKAKKIGLVSETYARERLLEQAPEYLRHDAKELSFKESLEHFAADNFVSRKIIFQKARESVLEKTKGFYQAPLKILDVMEEGTGKNRDKYLFLESHAFGELCVSEQSKNLQHIYFITERSKKLPGDGQNKDKIRPLKRGATLGAGTMGGGIAWLMSSINMNPIMKDINYEGIELGYKQASKNFSGALKRKKMSYDDFERKMRSIRGQLDFSGFSSVDLVIEAVVENMEVKKSVFKEVEKKVKENCVLTTNTSSLSVSEMAKVLERPNRFAGLHFFNPVHLMPLVEIITHEKISSETIAELYNWVISAKKTPLVVKDGPGFLVNRILMPYLNEAGHLLEEGVGIDELDQACLNFGMPMGPCRLLDEIGIDVGVKVADIIFDGLGSRATPAMISKKMVEQKFYGKKNKIGFYLYDETGKEAGLNEKMKALLPESSKKMDEVEIQMRVFLPMINEAAYILEDKIVDKAHDVDLGLIYGIGFPPFRGGLLRYADSQGLERILKAIKTYGQNVSMERYQASPYLEKLVEQKKKFYD